MNDFLTLLGNLWSFMLVVTLLAVAAGWSWAEMRARPKWRILEDERRYLRNDLFGAAATFKVDPGDPGGAPRSKRIADLEQALAEARGRGMEAEVLRLRIAELERGAHTVQPRPVAAFDITDYSEKIAALEEENAHLRAGRLTPDEQAEIDAERNRVFLLEQELEEARDKAAAAEALEARIKQIESAPPAVSQDDLTVLSWRNRYLSERVKYLETQEPPQALAPAPAPAPVVAAPSPEEQAAAKEQADRLAWRMRYLEQRALHLETAPKGEDAAPLKAKIGDLEAQLGVALARAPVLEGQIAPLQARIAELEAHLPGLNEKVAAGEAHGVRADDLQKRLADTEASAAQIHADLEHDMLRAKWKGRYLEARVRYLEGKVAAPQPAPVIAPPPVAPVLAQAPRAEKPTPTPPTPAAPAAPEMFRMERPAALSAPRNGAADDLRLILGVSGQVQSSLNAIGIFHFEQLAAWRPAHVAWVDQYLNLRGRIGAERWVEQSQALARGAALNFDHVS
jgi:predicted flap endonuclease-1-like 5' DNA nuclease